MAAFIAKYPGRCEATGDPIKPGDTIRSQPGGGYAHPNCSRNTTENREYAQGIADGERRQAERKIYGPALAEQFEMMDDYNRYWKYGED